MAVLRRNGRPSRGRWDLIAVFAGVAGFGGCTGGSDVSFVIVSDSSGVELVESRAAAWAEGSGWQISESPVLEIGAGDSSPKYQFHMVEGVLRMDDARVVVADGGSSEIRFFDNSGRFLSKTGGKGDAPGEFRMISGLGAGPGDSLWVFDYGNRRFTVLSSDGVPVRTVSVGGTLSAVRSVGRLPDGSFVVMEGWGSPRGGPARSGLTRDPVVIARFAQDGSTQDTLGIFPGREVFVSVEDGRGVMSTPLFARNTSAAVRHDALFVGDQERMEIGHYEIDGTLSRVFRVPSFELDISRADVEERMLQILEQQPVERRAAARIRLEAMDIPASRPAYGRLLVAADGSLWAAEQTRYPAIPRKWTVFAPDGHLLGTVFVPDRFKVFQIGIDWMLGVGLDELDVEHVRIHRLVK